MRQVTGYEGSELAEHYKPLPFAEGACVKGAEVAYRFTVQPEEGSSDPELETFYYGKIALPTKKGGHWINFEDGQVKYELKPMEYFDRWFFVAPKD